MTDLLFQDRDKVLIPATVRDQIDSEVAAMGRAATLVGHASVGGVSLVVLDMEPLDNGRNKRMHERRWLVVVEEPQASGNRTQTMSGIARTEWGE